MSRLMRFWLISLIVCALTVSLITAQTDDAPAPITATNAADLTPTLTLAGHVQPVLTAAFSPDGALLVTTGADLSLRLWDTANGDLLNEIYPHNAVTKGLAFDPLAVDGDRFFTASWDRTVRRHRIAADFTLDELPAFIGFGHIVDRVAFSDDGAWVGFAVGDGTVHLLENGAFDNRQVVPLDALTLLDMAFVPGADDGAFAVSTGFPDDGVYFGTFGMDDSDLVTMDHGHRGAVTALDFMLDSDDVPVMVTAGDDGLLRLWRVDRDGDGWAFDQLAAIASDGAAWYTRATFNSAGDVLAVATREGEIALYDVTDPTTPARVFTFRDESTLPVNALAFNAAGDVLASGDDSGAVTLWRIGAP